MGMHPIAQSTSLPPGVGKEKPGRSGGTSQQPCANYIEKYWDQRYVLREQMLPDFLQPVRPEQYACVPGNASPPSQRTSPGGLRQKKWYSSEIDSGMVRGFQEISAADIIPQCNHCSEPSPRVMR